MDWVKSKDDRVAKHIASLHTAARRYCFDGIDRWTDAYGKLSNGGRDGFEYTDEAYRIFPRYIVLMAILDDIEAIVPSNFENVEDLRRALVHAIEWADSPLSKDPHNRIQADAMSSERRDMIAYVRGLSEATLSDVDPLFYRRTLRRDEENAVWRAISERWHIKEHYWYPISDRDTTVDIEAFHVRTFDEEVGMEALRRLLSEHGISIVTVITEHDFPNRSHEIELAKFEPADRGAEQFYTSDGFDWIVYVSHESSITIGGWLLDAVKRKWPSWNARVYTSPFEP